eukprot:scaffold127939_cov19-Tisochrysis_lutea.AAC.2
MEGPGSATDECYLHATGAAVPMTGVTDDHLFKEAHLAYQAYLRTKQQQQQHLQEGHEQHIGEQQQQQQHLQEGQELQTGRGQQQERQGKLEQLEASLLLGREGSETEEGTAQGFGHAFRRPSSEAQMRTDALAGNAALEALYADALAKLQAFQQGSSFFACVPTLSIIQVCEAPRETPAKHLCSSVFRSFQQRTLTGH